MYYIGVDLGGTSIKIGLVDDKGNIVLKGKTNTNPKRGYKEVVADMAKLIKKISSDSQIDFNEISGIGIGTPGTPDSKNGVILFSSNLYFKNVPIRKELNKYIDMPIYLDNDANVAALAESEFGASKNVENSILLTLGTGIGGGIIIDNKIYSGFNKAGSELGHMTIVHDGLQCACGNKGCFEKYASALALVQQTIEGAKSNSNSILNKLVDYDYSKINAKTVFEGQRLNDETSNKVIKQYIDYLATGVVSLINILFPEYIIIGGGLGNEGENLLKPLREAVNKKVYHSRGILPTKIVSAQMGNDAGIIGAAMLVKQN